MRSFFGLLVLLSFLGCDEDEQQQAPLPPEPALYFPPSDSDEWETTDASMLNWNIAELSSLIDFLDSSNTRAFIILKDGRIVVEEYFGSNTLGTAPFDKDSRWYWASAGKTLTAALAGIAQQEGVLDIEAPVSSYLGTGWTSLSGDKEQLIRVRDQLSMTSGLEYLVTNNNCTLPSCLTYRTDAGQQWFYHNAVSADQGCDRERKQYQLWELYRSEDRFGDRPQWAVDPAGLPPCILEHRTGHGPIWAADAQPRCMGAN